MRFTKLAVESLKPRAARRDFTETGVSADRRGLILRVEPSGTKRFLCRFKLAGRAGRLTLGTYGSQPGQINLEEAHVRLDAARRYLRSGEMPPPFTAPRVAAARKQKRRKRRPPSPLFTAQPDGSPPARPAGAYSVELLAYEYYWRFCVAERRRPEYVARILEADVLPALRAYDVRSVKPRQIVELLDAVAARAPVMSNRVAAVVAQMFKFAIHRGLREDTPVQLLRPPGGREEPKERVLTDDELRAVWAKIPTMAAGEPIQIALRILALTGVRRGELAVARWEHVDLEAGEWLIPAAVHKNGKDFLTPIVPAVVAEFQRLRELAKESPHVMPSREGGGDKPIDPKAITKAVSRHLDHFGCGHWTPHDLRRTLRTGLGDLKIDDVLAERVIGHSVGTTVERTYNRAAYLVERRAALEKWAEHVQKVVA